MAKFTVYFKDKAIQSEIFDSGVVHIGRDDTNDLVIDSLAVAPVHAVVVIKGGQCLIKQMNDKFPLLVNNAAVKDYQLQDNDIINIGKHYIVFASGETTLKPDAFKESASQEAVRELNSTLEEVVKLPDANLQLMNGANIGRILPLKKPMTRLGHEGAGTIVIARRKDGYFVSALQVHAGLKVNGKSLGENTFQLANNDIIEVDNISMQFFLE